MRKLLFLIGGSGLVLLFVVALVVGIGILYACGLLGESAENRKTDPPPDSPDDFPGDFLTCTPRALEYLRQEHPQRECGELLFLLAEVGSFNDYHYTMGFRKEGPTEKERLTEVEEFCFITLKSQDYVMQGLVLDWQERGSSAGFVFTFPHKTAANQKMARDVLAAVYEKYGRPPYRE